MYLCPGQSSLLIVRIGQKDIFLILHTHTYVYIYDSRLGEMCKFYNLVRLLISNKYDKRSVPISNSLMRNSSFCIVF